MGVKIGLLKEGGADSHLGGGIRLRKKIERTWA